MGHPRTLTLALTLTLTRPISLGHGLTSPVVGHAYYGSAAVLRIERNLSKQPGRRQGETVTHSASVCEK